MNTIITSLQSLNFIFFQSGSQEKAHQPETEVPQAGGARKIRRRGKSSLIPHNRKRASKHHFK